jgi:hypothetical protein
LELNQKSAALENFNKAIELGGRVPQDILDKCKVDVDTIKEKVKIE